MSVVVENIREWLKNFLNDLKNIKNIGLNTFLKNHKYEVVATIGIILVLLMLPFILFKGETKNDVIYKFENSIKNNNPRELSKYLQVDDNKVDYERLIPLINYYKENSESLLKVVKGLKKYDKSGLFNTKVEKGFLRDKYYVNVTSLTVKFNVPTQDIKILLDEKEIVSSKVQKNIVPGKYCLNYNIETEFGDVSKEYYIDIFEDREINIDADVAFITLYSNFSDAKVFIGDKELGVDSGEILNYGPIPTNKDLQLYIKRDFPWGEISSEKVKITKDGYIKLDINMVNDILMTNVKEVINKFYETSFEALNSRDKSLVINCDEKVKEKVYNYIEEKALILKNNYKITDLNVEIEKSEFKYENEIYKGSIYTNIDYNVYKKMLPFIKTGYDSKFLISIVYRDGNWIIEDIQKFNDQ